MDKIQALDLAISDPFSILSFTLSMFGAFVLGYLIAFHYERYFPHISRSQSMGKTILTISITTFLIISVVKSSLALSLGLVGALSIIRFRTPIKEPFELSYLFLAIATGLGFGAQQYMPTTITVLFVLIVLTLFSKKIDKLNDNSYSFYLKINKKIESNIIENKILNLSKIIDADIYLKRIDQDKSLVQISLSVKAKSKDELLDISSKLKNHFSPESISITDNQKIMPF